MVYHRISLLLGFALLAILLAVLYAVGFVLPGLIGGVLWTGIAVCCFLCFRVYKVPVFSLSRASIVFYVYVACMFLWPAFYPQILIAVHSTGFQTPEIFAKANHLAAIGLAAFLAAWLAGFGHEDRPGRRRSISGSLPVSEGNFWLAVVASLPFLVLSFPTESILTHVYDPLTPATVGGGLEINVFKSAMLICLLLGLVSLAQGSTLVRRSVIWTLLVFAILVIGFARGSRVEELGCLLGVGWVQQSQQPRKALSRRWIVGSVLLGMFLLVLGEVRNDLPSQRLNGEYLASAMELALQVVPNSETQQMRPTTNGEDAVTLCVAIGFVDAGILQIDYGETFWRYLYMTLPRFMNPDRPVDLPTLLQRLAATGGGLFILAEPYVAGGPWGVMIVLGLFGFAIGALESRYVAGTLGQWHFLVYLLLLSCVPRWFLYGILPMYKHLLTGILIVLFIKFLSVFVTRLRPDSTRHWRPSVPGSVPI